MVDGLRLMVDFRCMTVDGLRLMVDVRCMVDIPELRVEREGYEIYKAK